MTEHVDVVVIGAGAMGSAAAWQLARAGRSVLVLEQHPFGHALGASHGATRNISASYASPVYQELLRETRQLFGELEDESGMQLVDWIGMIQHGDQSLIDELLPVHERFGVHSDQLSAAEAHERWPGMTFAGRVLFTHEAGRIRAADTLKALRAAAEARGVRFEYERPVRALDADGDAPIVRTDGGDLDARDVVVTAGAWTRGLLPSSFALPPLRVTQEQPAHFSVRDASAEWPNFIHRPERDAERDRYWYSKTYGMLTPDEGLKVGWHGTGVETDPDHRTFEYEERQMDALRRYVREWLPGADPDRFVPISCTYTTTPNEDFVIDRRGAVAVGAGFSGHGFKFAPVVGRILADLVSGRPAPAIFRLPAGGSVGV